MVAATPQNDRRWMALPRLIADRSCRAVVGLFFAVGAAMPAVSFAQTPQPGGTLTAIIQPEPVILTAAINTADSRSFLFHKQERLLAGQHAPRSTAADDVPAVAEIFGFAPWEYHCPAFEIAQRRLFFIELASRRMIELSIVDLWTSKILLSDRESMLVVTQRSD